VSKIISNAERSSHGALSHILDRSYGTADRLLPNIGKEPVQLNLHINNFEVPLAQMSRIKNNDVDDSHRYVVMKANDDKQAPV
jgi:hypothetical protein